MNTNEPIILLVLLNGLLDSINPCAIAVLLIFIALLFTLRKTRQTVILFGFIYIAVVFLTYLAIGLGILKVFSILNTPHFLAKAMAAIVLAVGLWGLKEYFWPGKFILLSIPLKARQLIASFAHKASLSATIIMGVLVGVTEFPCSGAIYLATVGLLSLKTTFLKGLAYLLLYNFMFVFPLIVLLILASNRVVTEKYLNFDETNSGRLRLLSALIMITLGIVLLVWFS